MDENKPDTLAAQGRRGGATTRDRHGKAHYRAIGIKGGQATLARYGREHYVALGHRGQSRIRALIARGKEIEVSAESPAAGGTTERSAVSEG